MAKRDYELIRRMIERPMDNPQTEVQKIRNERLQKFAKTNDFIQQFVAKMDRLELKLADYIMAKAYYSEDCPLEYTLSIPDFCKVAGLDYDSGANYANIKEAVRKMRSKAEWAKCDDNSGDEVLVGMISKAIISKRKGTVHIWLDEDMRRYVFQAKKAWAEKGIPYTEFLLLYMLPLKSRYARLLYELLKTWEQAEEHYWTISQLQELLGSNYDRYQDFRRKVLEIAVEQINEYTDIRVNYEPIKEGRSYKYILFYISTKSNKELILLKGNIHRALDGKELDGQLSMFDE